jgi:hypothetical protein
MKQFTDEQKVYLQEMYLEPRANAIMEMVSDRTDLNWSSNIQELKLIKTILEDMIDEEKLQDNG